MERFANALIRILIFLVTLSVTGALCAEYPNRDITFIVPYNPGGATDPMSRQFVGQLEKILPGNINIENKPGGSATIGSSYIVRAKPDGYTIGLVTNSSIVYQPLVNTTLVYKTPDDYQPIVKLMEQPVVLCVRADAPWKTFEEFMAEVKKNPGKIRASNSGVGTIGDLVVKQFNKVAGVKIVPVPFSGGGGEAMLALLGGRVQATTGFSSGVVGQANAGAVRVLAAFKKGKYEVFPQATPAFEAGYPVTLAATYYIIAPKGIPKDVQQKLAKASLQIIRSEEFLKFAKPNGYLLDPEPMGPEAAREELFKHMRVFSELIKISAQK